MTLTQQLNEQTTLTQVHLDMVDLIDVKKVNLVHELELLEKEHQKPTKDWDKINFLNTNIARLKNYIKCHSKN